MVTRINNEHVFLNPGEIAFGEAPMAVATLLGSCVSATLWHPHKLIGGMCHILLPENNSGATDTRFAECAVDYFVKQVKKYDSMPADYQVRLYGGGNMFPHIKRKVNMDIGKRNIMMMRHFLSQEGFRLRKGLDDVGGNTYRRLTLNLSTGDVYLKSNSVEHEPIQTREVAHVQS